MNTLPIAIVLTAVIRVITFFFSLKGAEPSGGVKFLLSVFGSLLAVTAAGHTETINEFSSSFAQLFASMQAVYASAKYVYRLFSSVFRRR